MKLTNSVVYATGYHRDEETLADALLHLRQMGYEGVGLRGFTISGSEGQADRGTGGNARPELPCFTLDAMEQELDGVLEDAKVLGLDTVAMAWSAADSPEAVARAVRVLQAAQSAAEP